MGCISSTLANFSDKEKPKHAPTARATGSGNATSTPEISRTAMAAWQQSYGAATMASAAAVTDTILYL